MTDTDTSDTDTTDAPTDDRDREVTSRLVAGEGSATNGQADEDDGGRPGISLPKPSLSTTDGPTVPIPVPSVTFRTASLEAKVRKYFRRKLDDGDVLLLVEWADGTQSELAAEYGVKDNVLEAENGLEFKLVGQGADPISYHGVPTIRCHALIDRPVDTTVAIAAEMEEEDRYVPVVDERGATEAVEHARPIEPGEASQGPRTAQGLEADGGTVVDHVYDLKPPSGTVGWAFSLTSAGQRAPNAVTSMDLHDAKERGKLSERTRGEALKYVAIGVAGTLAILIIMAVIFVGGMKVLGGGGGGGGGGQSFMMLLLAAPGAHLAPLRAWVARRLEGDDGPA